MAGPQKERKSETPRKVQQAHLPAERITGRFGDGQGHAWMKVGRLVCLEENVPVKIQ